MKNDADHKRIVNFLQHFNCSEKDTELYLQSLQLGPSSIQELAKSLGKHRVTVYSTAEKLLDKGLLYETKSGKKRLVVAESPQNLSRLIAQKSEELDVIRSQFDYVTQLLAPLESSSTTRPSVRFYEGKTGIKKMLEETLSAKGEVLVFSYVQLLAEIVGSDYLEKYFERRSKRQIKTRLIFPDCPFARRIEERSQELGIKIRYLQQEYEWRSGIFSWNHQLAILSYTNHAPTCTIIDSSDIQYFYRHIIFEQCWMRANASK